MCRQGGYYEQAAYLAEKHGETDLVVDILVEDSKRYDDALSFIWQQDPETVSITSLTLYFHIGVRLIKYRGLGVPMPDEVCEGAHRALP